MSTAYREAPGAEAHIARLKENLLQRLAHDIEQDAKRLAPVDDGHLRAQIEADEPVGDSVQVYTRRDVPGEDPNVPIYVEYGTAAHVIEPDEKQALAWPGMSGGPYKRVHHPGTRAQPYMRPALYRKRSY